MQISHVLSPPTTTLLLFLSSLLIKPNQATIRIVIATCHASSYLTGTSGGFCTTENNSDCCQAGQVYPQYHCSPPVTATTSAIMYISSFTQGSDGGGAAACDHKFHNDTELVVSLSTGWFDNKSRCLRNIRINGNGNSVVAKVVDECDSVNGCMSDQNYEPPCGNNIVVASPAVWDELDVSGSQRGELVVTWSDEHSG